MNPPLEDIQAAINEVAKRTLTISRTLPCWGQGPEVATYHQLLSGDKEVVKSVLRLTGSIEGMKNQVRRRQQGR
jgi:dynein heavy chain